MKSVLVKPKAVVPSRRALDDTKLTNIRQKSVV